MKKIKYIPYSPKLKDKVCDLRNNPTAAEKKMWYEVLRNKEFIGLNFNRQKPLLNFIIDFYCSKLLLGIELDGESRFEQKNTIY